MPFVRLAPAHDTALQAYLADYGDSPIPGYFCGRDWPHARCVDTLAAWSRGEQLQPGWVPCTTVFGIDGEELVGHYNVRHHLTEALEGYGGHIGYAVRPSARGRGHATALLGDALRLAASHGLDEVLITVDPENTPSVRVIEKNGGRRIDQRFHEGVQREVCRYRVATGLTG